MTYSEKTTPCQYDKIIIGAGLFGLYAATYAAKQGDRILVLEYDDAPFKRATHSNQARVHMGYHYPRSYTTAIKSAHYFDRFNREYEACIHKAFKKIYATSKQFSWSNAEQFQNFCHAVDIPCYEVSPNHYFNKDMCDGTFETTEYTYDAQILKSILLEEIKRLPQVSILYNCRIASIQKEGPYYVISDSSSDTYKTPFLLNATYAAINQVHNLLGYPPFKIKYELCEIILCQVNSDLREVGITVMDGPFFSIMPFGKTGYHSLTSVTFTPHKTSYDALPHFDCQEKSQGHCSPFQLGNCNTCPAKPKSAWRYMSALARKYLKENYAFEYVDSLFSIKPILMASELDDSRPTVIKQYSKNPTFISVLSGKINAVYDLEEVLKNE
ncbi:FAD-dependent oxidoreductase [Fusibacter ferrireducens]|uniref:FAD-dependent oxidoreductase n=1 Tax=Fusibacter ferrireducens TaxID=2785058 RepID=A0ABR9ZXC9_9FIRM|nr:FAD-dependent oxidoreductase [Fusibacter ferrireducens]MBF4694515.1 FAD-dependent oxidoreductase [Fusibacter ferrireducens]